MQIISQNYVVWNLNDRDFAQMVSTGCKLYHKTTWFETAILHTLFTTQLKLQIISQNYVVWNANKSTKYLRFGKSCKLYHKTTWLETQLQAKTPPQLAVLQIISQNYVVWNTQKFAPFCELLNVANYITKLRGLKHKS